MSTEAPKYIYQHWTGKAWQAANTAAAVPWRMLLADRPKPAPDKMPHSIRKVKPAKPLSEGAIGSRMAEHILAKGLTTVHIFKAIGPHWHKIARCNAGLRRQLSGHAITWVELDPVEYAAPAVDLGTTEEVAQ